MSLMPLPYKSISRTALVKKGISSLSLAVRSCSISDKAKFEKYSNIGADFDGDIIDYNPFHHRRYKQGLSQMCFINHGWISLGLGIHSINTRIVSIRQKANPFKLEHPR